MVNLPDNSTLTTAKRNRKDEFYTCYEDIEREMFEYLRHDPHVFRGKTVLLPCDDPQRSNFTKFFQKHFDDFEMSRLISTCYASEGRGRIFDTARPGLNELSGDGDFQSAEVTQLRDQADLVITNPPFSLLRPFVQWLMGGGVQFSVIGVINAIGYKQIFSHLESGEIWLGPSIHSGDRKFLVPDDYPLTAKRCGFDEEGRKFVRVTGVRWFTNISHSRNNRPIELKTMAQNQATSKHKSIRDNGYRTYDNYPAIEVPFVDAIPSDFSGLMGVPITFLDKHAHQQFDLVGLLNNPIVGGREIYKRVIIRPVA